MLDLISLVDVAVWTDCRFELISLMLVWGLQAQKVDACQFVHGWASCLDHGQVHGLVGVLGWLLVWLLGWLVCLLIVGLPPCKETNQAIFLNHNSFAALRIEHMQSLFSSWIANKMDISITNQTNPNQPQSNTIIPDYIKPCSPNQQVFDCLVVGLPPSKEADQATCLVAALHNSFAALHINESRNWLASSIANNNEPIAPQITSMLIIFLLHMRHATDLTICQS